MNKYTLYVGLNDQKTKTQLISTLEAYKIVNNIVLTYTEGATVYEASGIYKHDDGSIVIEKTLRIELLFINEESVLQIISDLKKALNQESVVMQKDQIISKLI